MEPLCYAPFVAMYASSKSGYAPCCVSKKFSDAGPEQFWSGEVMSRIRSELSNGKFPASCSYCSKKAALGIKAESDHWKSVYDSLGRPPLDLKAPLSLDYRPSNQCNLKCRMCGVDASSSIETEVKQNPHLREWYGDVKDVIVEAEAMSAYIDGVALKSIKLLGGEPSIDPSVWDFIDRAAAMNPQPSLHVTTNGTSLNPTFTSLLRKFDNLKVQFSVDAVGREYDYIRTNARWKNTERNILNFFEDFRGRCGVGFNVVLSPYNIFCLNGLMDWLLELVNKGYEFDVFFMDSDDEETGLSAVLPEHIDWALTSLDYRKITALNCHGLIELLESAEFKGYAHRKFKKYSAELDKIRKSKLIELDDRFSNYTAA